MLVISIYLIILVLAMIRYGLEKTWFIEHLFYTIGIFIITGCLGLQVGAQVMQKTNDLYIS